MKKTGSDHLFTTSIILLIFLTLVAMIYFTEEKDKRTELIQKSVPIYSMKPANKVTGDFSLGFGRIDNTDYYLFLEKKNGGFIRKQVPVNETLILEKDTYPSITTNSIVNIYYANTLRGKKEVRDTLDYSCKLDEFRGVVLPIKKDLGYKYIITIPKGSIMENQVYQVL